MLHHSHHARALPLAAVLLAAACTGDPANAPTASLAADQRAEAARGEPARGVHVQYGAPVAVGLGRARAYVIRDAQAGDAPIEIGVALDERALDGLPEPMPPHDGMEHGNMHEYRLPLPPGAPAPYTFVELDWNPAGHSAPYHVRPHFDFHFWGLTLDERNAIVQADPQWVAKARNFPAPAYLPAGWFCPCTLLGIPPEAVAVERMGIHWIDPTSPEYRPQPKGVPQDFTATYIVGTWDGRVIFQEPMVTREFLLSRPELAKAVPLAAAHAQAGWYPSSWRVRWDEHAREYRVALAGLTHRE